MFLVQVPGSRITVTAGRPLAEHMPVGTQVDYQSHIDMFTAQGTMVPWLCSQTDMVAQDWDFHHVAPFHFSHWRNQESKQHTQVSGIAFRFTPVDYFAEHGCLCIALVRRKPGRRPGLGLIQPQSQRPAVGAILPPPEGRGLTRVSIRAPCSSCRSDFRWTWKAPAPVPPPGYRFLPKVDPLRPAGGGVVHSACGLGCGPRWKPPRTGPDPPGMEGSPDRRVAPRGGNPSSPSTAAPCRVTMFAGADGFGEAACDRRLIARTACIADLDLRDHSPDRLADRGWASRRPPRRGRSGQDRVPPGLLGLLGQLQRGCQFVHLACRHAFPGGEAKGAAL